MLSVMLIIAFVLLFFLMIIAVIRLRRNKDFFKKKLLLFAAIDILIITAWLMVTIKNLSLSAALGIMGGLVAAFVTIPFVD